MTHATPSTAPRLCTAFSGDTQLASGTYLEVALAAKTLQNRQDHRTVLVFDDTTGRQIDFDLRGSDDDVARRLELHSNPPPTMEPPRGPGRPRLGVVAREVTLLPRHWEWLNSKPGGASVALRKLVEAARAGSSAADSVRDAQAAADRFMLAMAGNLENYEDAARALYAGNARRFRDLTSGWPAAIRVYARKLAAPAFAGSQPSALA